MKIPHFYPLWGAYWYAHEVKGSRQSQTLNGLIWSCEDLSLQLTAGLNSSMNCRPSADWPLRAGFSG